MPAASAWVVDRAPRHRLSDSMVHMTSELGPSALPLLLALTASAALAAPPDLARTLAKAILESDLPMVEAQVYTATRVPPMPPVRNAAEWRQEAERLRRKLLSEVVLRGEAKRWHDARTR